MKNWKNVFTTFLMAFLAISLTYAQKSWGSGISGQGPTVERTLNVSPFTGVGLAFSGDVFIKQGSTQSVKVVGQQNIIDNIDTEVKNGHWNIGFKKSVKKMSTLKVYITIPNLTKAVLSGSGNLSTDGQFNNVGELPVSLSGSGNINLTIDAKRVVSKISGSGNIKLSGSAGSHEIGISGSGNVNAFDLNSGECDVRISGSGNCRVDVKSNLDVRISGSGDVAYKGSPRVNSRISGSGNVTSR